MILVACLPARAYAGSGGAPANASTTLRVSATVVTACVMSTTSVSFGGVDAVLLADGETYHAHGTVNIQCASGYVPAIGMRFDGGRNQAAAQALGVLDAAGNQAVRAMSNGISALAYTLYEDSAATTAIVPNVPVSNLPARAFSANGQSPYAYNVYGMIPGGSRQTGGPEGLTQGSYTDSIEVTLE